MMTSTLQPSITPARISLPTTQATSPMNSVGRRKATWPCSHLSTACPTTQPGSRISIFVATKTHSARSNSSMLRTTVRPIQRPTPSFIQSSATFSRGLEFTTFSSSMPRPARSSIQFSKRSTLRRHSSMARLAAQSLPGPAKKHSQAAAATRSPSEILSNICLRTRLRRASSRHRSTMAAICGVSWCFSCRSTG